MARTSPPWTTPAVVSLYLLVALLAADDSHAAVNTFGELRKWHKITLQFDGPSGYSETSEPNPFADCRLDVTFTHGSRSYKVPGHYAADGDAANTGAKSGKKWHVHFAPDATGEWEWSAAFVRGNNVGADASKAGTPHASIDGLSGTFSVKASNKSGRDHRGKGRLQYVGKRYLRFAETGEYFLKAGADSPENYLAYEDFDDVVDRKRKSWGPHVQDFETGDPTWQNGKGKGIIGAVNYMSKKGMNVQSFITNNLEGFDRNVFPWISNNTEESRITDDDLMRYDVSKLAQWEIVFEHMDHKGIYLHFKTQESRNSQMLSLRERELYYRELISRFSHHLALNWNIGEETKNTEEEIIQFGWLFTNLDPYKHNVVIHSLPGGANYDRVFGTILRDFESEGRSAYTGFSFQVFDPPQVHRVILQWSLNAEEAGKSMVLSMDELGHWRDGVLPDSNTTAHNVERKDFLWGTYLAQGAGTESYFGFDHECNDLECEDLRSRDKWWNQCYHALEFFRKYVRYWDSSAADEVTGKKFWVLRDPGQTYVIYMFSENSNPAQTSVQLSTESTDFRLSWFNPKSGGQLTKTDQTCLQKGTTPKIVAPSSSDWVALLQAGCEERTQPENYPRTVNPNLPTSPTPGSCGAEMSAGQIPACFTKNFVFSHGGKQIKVKIALSNGRIFVRAQVPSNFWIKKMRTGPFRTFVKNDVPVRTWSGRKNVRTIYADPLEIPSSSNCCGERLKVPFWITFCKTSDGTCIATKKQVFKLTLKCKTPCTALFGSSKPCGVCE